MPPGYSGVAGTGQAAFRGSEVLRANGLSPSSCGLEMPTSTGAKWVALRYFVCQRDFDTPAMVPCQRSPTRTLVLAAGRAIQPPNRQFALLGITTPAAIKTHSPSSATLAAAATLPTRPARFDLKYSIREPNQLWQINAEFSRVRSCLVALEHRDTFHLH